VRTWEVNKQRVMLTGTILLITRSQTGADPGRLLEQPPLWNHEGNFIRHDFLQYGNSIFDIRPSRRTLFCHSSIVKYIIPITVAKPLRGLTSKCYWYRKPLTSMARYAPGLRPLSCQRLLLIGPVKQSSWVHDLLSNDRPSKTQKPFRLKCQVACTTKL